MGCRVTSYFLNWIESQEWIDAHVETVAFLAPPFLGAPFALKAMITGETLNLSPLISPHEGYQICRSMGSWPWLLPPVGHDAVASMFPEPAARVKISSQSKKKKDKDAYAAATAIDALKSTGAPGAKFFADYFEADKYFNVPKGANPAPYLDLPPVKKLLCMYGVNLPTEISYFFRVNDENPALVQADLDSSQDSLSEKETKVLNPAALEIRGGIMFETKKTVQPAFEKKKISGDGSIPYASLAYCHKLKQRATALKAAGKAAPEIEIIELEGVGHRLLLSNDATIATIIDLGCK